MLVFLVLILNTRLTANLVKNNSHNRDEMIRLKIQWSLCEDKEIVLTRMMMITI